MSLTPLDVEKVTFHTAFRGYARAEVEQFLVNVADALQGYIEQLRKQDERIAAIERELERYHQNEDLLKSSVMLAQKTCDELIAAAHKQADVIKREADLEGGDIRRQLTDLRAEREQFEYAFHGLLTGFQRRLEQNNPQLVAQNQPVSELTVTPFKPPSSTEPDPSHPVAASAPRVRTAPAPREDMFRPAQSPPAQPAPQPQAAMPATDSPEFDRDADIGDFSAALNDAPVPITPGWPEHPPEQNEQIIEASPLKGVSQPKPGDDEDASSAEQPRDPPPL